MPRITVDGMEIDVPDGRTLLQALDDVGLLMNGVEIPHYCWHPKLSIDGSCRLCQVEIEGMPKLQIACNTPVKDGMEIRTAGIIRTTAPRFSELNGKIALVVERLSPDKKIEVTAYQF